MKLFFIGLIIITSFTAAIGDSTDVYAGPVREYPLVLRVNMVYVPLNMIEFTNFDVTYDVYDNIFYHFGADYMLVDFLSGGISLEYLNRRIEPVSYHHKDITGINVITGFKLIHNFTESGSTKLIGGVGSGYAYLKEQDGESNSNIIAYVATGLDIALWNNIGLDFIYRYQYSKLKIEFAEYSYNGSTLQFGLNYGIDL